MSLYNDKAAPNETNLADGSSQLIGTSLRKMTPALSGAACPRRESVTTSSTAIAKPIKANVHSSTLNLPKRMKDQTPCWYL